MYQYGDHAKETLEQLSGKGVFLTVRSGQTVNTMTIGWGSVSQYWGEEVFIAPVRFSRYTFDLLQNADEFTVSIPTRGQFDEALKLCGTLSGRDGNKLEKAGLTLKDAQTVAAPLIDGCDLYYECKVLYTTDLDKAVLDPARAERWYADGNMHRLYFGKILACHR